MKRTSLFLIAAVMPGIAAAAGLTAESIVGTVKVQRPGTDGNPGLVQLLGELLLNKPKAIEEGAALRDKDGLRGGDANSAVQLLCANGATLTLSGEFDAYLRLGAGDQGCTVYLRAGTVVATTGTSEGPQIPTVIQYGEVTLGAKSTQFGATITSSTGAKQIKADAFVIEGAVDVQKPAPAGGMKSQILLQTGQQLSADAAVATTISEARFDALAGTYASLGAKAAPPPLRAATQQELKTAYSQSLRRPLDPAAQTALVKVYAVRQLKVSPVVKYKNYQINKINPAALAVPKNLAPAATPVAPQALQVQ